MSPGELVSKLACPPGSPVSDFTALIRQSEEDSWEGPASPGEAVRRIAAVTGPITGMGQIEARTAITVADQVTDDAQLLAIYGANGPVAYFLAERVWNDWIVSEYIHCTEFIEV